MIICPVACRRENAPNKLPVSIITLVLGTPEAPANSRSSSASVCIIHNARLCKAGTTPEPKLLNIVKPANESEAAVVGAVLDKETRACEMKSIAKQKYVNRRSKRISAMRYSLGLSLTAFTFEFAPVIAAVLGSTAGGLGLKAATITRRRDQSKLFIFNLTNLLGIKKSR